MFPDMFSWEVTWTDGRTIIADKNAQLRSTGTAEHSVLQFPRGTGTVDRGMFGRDVDVVWMCKFSFGHPKDVHWELVLVGG